jgi:sugar porter (SP) family MFS transporter
VYKTDGQSILLMLGFSFFELELPLDNMSTDKVNSLDDVKQERATSALVHEQSSSDKKSDETIHSFLGLRGKYLSYMISLIAGTGFLLFGYDQGVMGSLLTQTTFRETFPEIDAFDDSSKSTYQGFVIAVYEVGCAIGAIFTMWYGDKVGRRKTIFTGCLVMIAGATIQASAFSTSQLLVGRIVAGVGNGMNTSTVPVWQSECARPEKRGKLVMVQGALITGGIMISYWIDFGFYFVENNSSNWRFPVAFQMFFALVILPFILELPESPRWLIKMGEIDEAVKVFSALEAVPETHPFIRRETEEITAVIAEETANRNANSWKQLFVQGEQRNFHRVCLAVWNQIMQQITGINLVTYYAGTIFQQYIGMTPLNSRILAACNGTEYFIASWIAVFTVEKLGRRKLMIFGALGQAGSMAILTGTNWAGEYKNNTAASIAAAVFLFVFNTFFAIGWLGMSWLYPAEITPLSIRGMSNGLSTAANWSFNFMVVMITPVAFANIGCYTYTIFAATNLAMVPFVYFLYPETAGRTLEEMDTIFAMSDPYRPWEVVHNARTQPFEYRNGNFQDLEKASVTNVEDVEQVLG